LLTDWSTIFKGLTSTFCYGTLFCEEVEGFALFSLALFLSSEKKVKSSAGMISSLSARL
jgi:hypothetical protein